MVDRNYGGGKVLVKPQEICKYNIYRSICNIITTVTGHILRIYLCMHNLAQRF